MTERQKMIASIAAVLWSKPTFATEVDGTVSLAARIVAAAEAVPDPKAAAPESKPEPRAWPKLRPMSEAPRDGTEVLLIPKSDDLPIRQAHYCIEKGWDCSDLSAYIYESDCLGWLPLPTLEDVR